MKLISDAIREMNVGFITCEKNSICSGINTSICLIRTSNLIPSETVNVLLIISSGLSRTYKRFLLGGPHEKYLRKALNESCLFE